MPDKKLPLELQPDRLLTAPTMVVGLGFDCPVMVPLTRSTDKRGMIIALAEGPDGPKLVITVADGQGHALAGVIGEKEFPGFLELVAKQSQRMRDRLTGDQAPSARG